MSTNTARSRRVRLRFWGEWVFLAAFLLLIIGMVAYERYGEYQRLDVQEREHLAMQAQTADRYLSQQITAANRALDSLLYDLHPAPGDTPVHALTTAQLQGLVDMLTGVRTLMVLDETGVVTASNKTELIGQNLGTRPYFELAQREASPNVLYVTPPFVTVLKTYVVNLVRARLTPQGHFAGIVAATIDPDELRTVLDSVRYSDDVSIQLHHDNGKVFLRSPAPVGDEVPADEPLDPSFTAHQIAKTTHNVGQFVQPVTGRDMLVATRTVRTANVWIDKAPVLAVARPVSAVYAVWREDAIRAALLLTLMVAAAVGGLLFYQRWQGRFERLARQQEVASLESHRALQRSEQRFQTLLAMSSDWFWQQDTEYRFTEFGGIGTLPDSPLRSFLGKTRWELPIQLTPEQWSQHRAVLDARQPFKEFRYSIVDSSGKTLWYSINGQPVFGDEGEFLGYQGTGRDITERMLAEQELRVAATAFQSQEGIVVTDADTRILRVNRAFTDITGYQAHEVIGQSPRLLRSGRHDNAFFAAMWDSIERTGTWQGEIWNRRKSGEIYPQWQIITAVKDDLGRVTHYVGTQTDITEEKQAQAKIESLAFFDPLTRLPNRRMLLDRMQQALALGQRTGLHSALLFIDLDNFKALNDTRGHNVGDLLLQQVAQRLSTCVRAGDTVARLGGDEFVVMLENLSDSADTAATQAEAVGEKVLALLNRPYELDGQAHHSTPSIGITLMGNGASSVDEFLKQSDLAMYQAKKSGRNAVRFFDPEMQRGVAARVALETDLREALAHDQFVLHYQRQVDSSGRTTGAEALVRWQHPKRGFVSPAEFIPLAEETGLIIGVGNWVLRQACAQLARWSQHPESAQWTLAVNISARQLHQAEFVGDVLSELRRAHAPAHRLKLELTESLLLHDIEETIVKMNFLKERGVGFSLDDFGTGFSSLSYLKRLPLDQLKIDRSFVRDVLTDPNDAAIIRTIVALAHAMGMTVIAEGVETQAQCDALAEHGCHAYQGYLYGRPGPAGLISPAAH